MPETKDQVEELAAYAHEAWSGWQRYLFGKCWTATHDDFRRPMPGSVVIPPELAERWERQMSTPYSELPEKEKESDREEARKILKIVADTNKER
jgi:hypothetical protein